MSAPPFDIRSVTLSSEERIAILETKITSIGSDITRICDTLESMRGDIGQLTQLTTFGKLVWKAILWAGAAVSGTVALVYMLTQIGMTFGIHMPNVHSVVPSININPTDVVPQ